MAAGPVDSLCNAKVSGGDLYVLYLAEGSDSLRLAVEDGTGWQIDSPAGGQEVVPGQCAIAIDEAGRAHALYVPTSTLALSHAVEGAESWSTTTVDPALTSALSAASGSGGVTIQVAYVARPDDCAQCGELRFATLDEDGVWTIETVPQETPQAFEDVSMIVDASSTAHIAHHGASNADELLYSRSGPGGWTTTMVDDAGRPGEMVELRLDEDASVHILYRAMVSGELRHATNESGEWVREVLDPARVLGIDLAVAAGELHAVDARDVTRDGIWYRHRRSGRWRTELLREPALGGKLAVGPEGELHLFFVRGEAKELWQAVREVASGSDDNCDGIDGMDDDGDRVASFLSGGDDCDDRRSDVHPGADDAPEDGLDSDCDGQDD